MPASQAPARAASTSAITPITFFSLVVPLEKRDLAEQVSRGQQQVMFIDNLIETQGDNGKEILTSWLTLEIKSTVAHLLGVGVVELDLSAVEFAKRYKNKGGYEYYNWRASFKKDSVEYRVRWHTFVPGQEATPEPCLRISKQQGSELFYLVNDPNGLIKVKISDEETRALNAMAGKELPEGLRQGILVEEHRNYVFRPSNERPIKRQTVRIWANPDGRLATNNYELNRKINDLSHIPLIPAFLIKASTVINHRGGPSHD